jgi:hypothetical protein
LIEHSLAVLKPIFARLDKPTILMIIVVSHWSEQSHSRESLWLAGLSFHLIFNEQIQGLNGHLLIVLVVAVALCHVGIIARQLVYVNRYFKIVEYLAILKKYRSHA